MKTLLDETFVLLDGCDKTISDLAEVAGVNRHWLEKFKQRRYSDPRIKSVQRLHDYLKSTTPQAAA